MNSLPTLVNSKNCINKETSTQKRLNRKYDIHHDKPCRLSIWIQPLSLSLFLRYNLYPLLLLGTLMS